ncbi:MAG: hypothetical protein RL603_152 [Pseudomonadota bacterium]|jgi:ADP-ribosyl-[dinitrogen reductase] hydrolase
MLGLAVADALATPAQWSRPGSAPPIRDLIGGGPHDLPRGAWRADTAMALCTAASLSARGRYERDAELAELRAWQREGAHSATGECVGITAGVAHALVNGAPSIDIDDGLDACVRAIPIALFHFADSAAREQALATSAALTSREPVTSARVRIVVAALRAALHGDERAWRSIWDDLGEAQVVTEPRLIVRQILFGESTWKDAALAAANLGGEAQGIPALVGALAGARYGVEAIPLAWRESVAHATLLRERSDGLLADALVELAGLA